MEATLGTDATDLWSKLGIRGAAQSLLSHISIHRSSPSNEELFRLFTIDEAEHGPLDSAIDEIHAMLRRIEESRNVSTKFGHLRSELNVRVAGC